MRATTVCQHFYRATATRCALLLGGFALSGCGAEPLPAREVRPPTSEHAFQLCRNGPVLTDTYEALADLGVEASTTATVGAEFTLPLTSLTELQGQSIPRGCVDGAGQLWISSAELELRDTELRLQRTLPATSGALACLGEGVVTAGSPSANLLALTRHSAFGPSYRTQLELSGTQSQFNQPFQDVATGPLGIVLSFLVTGDTLKIDELEVHLPPGQGFSEQRRVVVLLDTDFRVQWVRQVPGRNTAASVLIDGQEVIVLHTSATEPVIRFNARGAKLAVTGSADLAATPPSFPEQVITVANRLVISQDSLSAIGAEQSNLVAQDPSGKTVWKLPIESPFKARVNRVFLQRFSLDPLLWILGTFSNSVRIGGHLALGFPNRGEARTQARFVAAVTLQGEVKSLQTLGPEDADNPALLGQVADALVLGLRREMGAVSEEGAPTVNQQVVIGKLPTTPAAPAADAPTESPIVNAVAVAANGLTHSLVKNRDGRVFHIGKKSTDYTLRPYGEATEPWPTLSLAELRDAKNPWVLDGDDVIVFNRGITLSSGETRRMSLNVFSQTADGWEITQSLAPALSADEQRSPYADLLVTEHYLFLGALGRVRVFERTAEGWKHHTDLTAAQGWFGSALAFNGLTLAVATPEVRLPSGTVSVLYTFQLIDGRFETFGVPQVRHSNGVIRAGSELSTLELNALEQPRPLMQTSPASVFISKLQWIGHNLATTQSDRSVQFFRVNDWHLVKGTRLRLGPIFPLDDRHYAERDAAGQISIWKIAERDLHTRRRKFGIKEGKAAWFGTQVLSQDDRLLISAPHFGFQAIPALDTNYHVFEYDLRRCKTVSQPLWQSGVERRQRARR